MDQNQDRQRGHSHRPRRGPDRRGPARRPATQQAQERSGRDQVDVEQIMRDIRGRIAQRQGIDLSNQQIQDLAARRLESILDPRAIKPSLLDGLRRGAAAAIHPADKAPSDPAFTFEDSTLYDSHRASLRFARRLLNPILKLFFNPNPLIQALHLQAKLNEDVAARNADRDRRQTEWNALHFEIIQRLVTEVSRASLELQALSLRVEALAARVDFNDRRVSTLEGAAHRARPQGRPAEPSVPGAIAPPDAAQTDAISTGDSPTSEIARKRRRRRRGRRGSLGAMELPSSEAQIPSTFPAEPDANIDSLPLAQDRDGGEPGPDLARPVEPSAQFPPAHEDTPEVATHPPLSVPAEDPDRREE
jgi:hypothetical protein